MPPKPMIEKKDVLDVAIEIVRTKGIEHINARSLAEGLNCSTKPLFRIYKNMELLKKDIFIRADDYLGNYLTTYHSKYESPVLDIGLAYIDFAKKEPKLFQLIYMSGNFSFAHFKQFIYRGKGEEIFLCVSDTNHDDLNPRDKENLYLQLMIYAHGIASMVATNPMEFSEDFLVALLINAYTSFRANIKNFSDDSR